MQTLRVLGVMAAMVVGPAFVGASAFACDKDGKKSVTTECDKDGKKSLGVSVSCDKDGKKSLDVTTACDKDGKKS